MKLYLIQHGEAVDKDIDPDRPLSETGRGDIGNLERWLADHGVHLRSIRHSGKTRALQTAQILSGSYSRKGAVEAIDGIAPNDDPLAFARGVEALEDGAAVVSHLPFVARLASTLLCEDPEVVSLAFAPGSIACLEREAGRWALAWMLRPREYAAGYDFIA